MTPEDAKSYSSEKVHWKIHSMPNGDGIALESLRPKWNHYYVTSSGKGAYMTFKSNPVDLDDDFKWKIFCTEECQPLKGNSDGIFRQVEQGFSSFFAIF